MREWNDPNKENNGIGFVSIRIWNDPISRWVKFDAGTGGDRADAGRGAISGTAPESVDLDGAHHHPRPEERARSAKVEGRRAHVQSKFWIDDSRPSRLDLSIGQRIAAADSAPLVISTPLRLVAPRLNVIATVPFGDQMGTQ
jgi:hypothetical protein